MKAKLIPSDAVEKVIGHAPGGVCQFGINDGVEVYLDESLQKGHRLCDHARLHPKCFRCHRKDDVLFTGRAGGADSDGRHGESR